MTAPRQRPAAISDGNQIDPAALKEQLAGLMDADAYQALAGA